MEMTICGISICVDESFTARMRGLNIYIHPKYEMVTLKVIDSLMKDWSSISPKTKRLGDLSLSERVKAVKKQLRRFIPCLVTK